MSLEAWIDVGGTFTDCLVRTANGQILRTKTLSSGRIPVSAVRNGNERAEVSWIEFAELSHDCDSFWNGAQLHGYNARGEPTCLATVLKFQQGRVYFDRQFEVQGTEKYELLPGCEAPVLAVRRLLQLPLQHAMPPMTVRLGTTRGTNALLTRTGAKVALLITSPFEDLLEIGDQTRPDLFALNIVKPAQLTQIALGISERLEPTGQVQKPLNLVQAKEQLCRAKALGCNSIAISLMHGYCNPQHEVILAELAGKLGFEHVSVSHQLASVVEFVARTQTTVVDAYLSPIIRQYFGRLCDQFGSATNVNLLAMTSAGGLVDWREYSGKDCILSGPAGGVVALSHIQATYQQPIIGLDMGGTSTDVSRAGEQLELQYESTKAGVRILTPTLPIETVASGGGSICWFDGVSLRVGPQSAGAFPGPACYGRGGPLTITDLNVVSGRVPARQFPFPIDVEASWKRIDELVEHLNQSHHQSVGQNPNDLWCRAKLVDGLRRLATQQMAEAVRTVSIKQGADPRQHALIGFGGAAGQHICEIAEELGIGTVLDHADAGLLSAVGMGLAQRRLDHVFPVYELLHKVDFNLLLGQSAQLIQQLKVRILPVPDRAEARSQSSTQADITWELRYAGTDSTLSISIDHNIERSDAELLVALQISFSKLHGRRFGYVRQGRDLELVALRVGVSSAEQRSLPACVDTNPIHAKSVHSNLYDTYTIDTNSIDTNLAKSKPASDSHSNPNSGALKQWMAIDRASLKRGDCVDGPIIILNAGSTLVIEQQWQFEVLDNGMLSINRKVSQSNQQSEQTSIAISAPKATVAQSSQSSTAVPEAELEFDPVLRDCYAQRLSAIATQMGYVLQQTAVSVNIKQRRDYSCAVFDGTGNLLANAPHVPVHLGAMGVTVRAIIDRFPQMRPGDSFLCNDPYCGGSHLPDLTLVRPVFDQQQNRPSFFVANRAHHADIGGIAPGSMSIVATRLEQEGVVISPFQLASGNVFRWEELKNLIDVAAHPPRNWNENLADLNAQQAACVRGEQLLCEYSTSIGWTKMKQYAVHLLEAGHARFRQFIQSELDMQYGQLEISGREFEDELEDGTPIRVKISKPTSDRLKFDFAGTGPASSTNLNANPSIVSAAILYVLRTLINDELPLNEGVLRAVDLMIPVSVLNPQSCEPVGLSPAVAAGNVETSQRIVDVLLGAFQAAAASQGTMNNLLFGNEKFGFYETICGGSGATAMADGASAVHTHMTNTRLTDPEVLEQRYPVRLIEFHIRHGSGGGGRHRGGDGIVRTFEFRSAVTLSLLTSRRKSGPFGLSGGKPGTKGQNRLRLPGGDWTLLPSSCQTDLPAGSSLSILTPGGGGFGPFQGE